MGLIATRQPSVGSVGEDIPFFSQPILPTEGTVGEATAAQIPGGITNWSLTNLKTEIRNTMAQLRTNRQSNSSGEQNALPRGRNV